MDLESFSKHILANPTKFIERSKDRARFYFNVIKPRAKKGGALSSHVMSDLLAQSYETKNKKKRRTEIDGFHIDPSLSGERVQVWYNPTTKQAVVVHRGTASFQDVMTDARLFFGDKSGKRFRHAENIQKKAEAKYGKAHVSTLGHSLGSSVAEKVGQNSKEVLTLNKPTTLEDLAKGKKVSEKQTDVRTKYDPVSILRPHQKGSDAIEIESTTWNPLAEHKTDTLKRLDEDVMIGRGKLGAIMRGAGTGSSRVVPQDTEVDALDEPVLSNVAVRVEGPTSLIDRIRLPTARPVQIVEGEIERILGNRERNRSFWNDPEIQRILAELQEQGSDDDDDDDDDDSVEQDPPYFLSSDEEPEQGGKAPVSQESQPTQPQPVIDIENAEQEMDGLLQHANVLFNNVYAEENPERRVRLRTHMQEILNQAEQYMISLPTALRQLPSLQGHLRDIRLFHQHFRDD